MTIFGIEGTSLRSGTSENVSPTLLKYVEPQCVLILAYWFNFWIIRTFKVFFDKQSKIKLRLGRIFQ